MASEHRPPNSQALTDALGALESRAILQGNERQVHLRVAFSNGKLYYDLADKEWRVVEIDSDGWRVVSNPPVYFQRANGMLPQVEPTSGGSIDLLRPFFNVSSDVDWRLVVGWLIGSFRHTGPYPIMIFQGEHGSAKSTAARVLRLFVDPSVTPLRTLPRSERDLFISASKNFVMAFDNLSGLTNEVSDWMCRIATEGGMAIRKLYTDDEEKIFKAVRPIILNGIDSLVHRADLADRSLIINLVEIPDNEKQEEAEFWADLNKIRPQILGVICNAISAALRNIPSVKLDSLPRMADAARWVTAAEPVLGWSQGTFLDAYNINRMEVVEQSLEASAVTVALRSLLQYNRTLDITAGDLLELLNKKQPEKLLRSKYWPQTPSSLSRQLRRNAPFLRKIGINIEFEREGGTGQRKILITKVEDGGEKK